MTRPQQKAVAEVVRGLFTKGQPILTHLAQNPACSAKKQAEKYSYHLGHIDLTACVEAIALRKIAATVRKNTVIAYDMTDWHIRFTPLTTRCSVPINEALSSYCNRLSGYVHVGRGVF
jgi:hypothetical protein